jgi:hypothetical protein
MVAIGLGLLLFVFHSVRKLGLQMNEIGASSFGERVIHMGDGRSIYLKHEARGQNFDVVSVSENPNVCDSASAEADLIFKYDANPLTISQSENDLIIFWAWGFSQPKHPLVHVLVKNVRPDSLSSEDKASMKVQQIDIPLEFEKVKDGDCKRK